MPKLIGAHLSASKGIHTIQEQMDKLESNTCAVFLKNQKRYAFTPIKEETIKLFRKLVVFPELVVPHASYLINFGNRNLVDKSMSCLVDDLERCKVLGIKMYNMHPGNDKQGDAVKCLKDVSEHIDIALSKVSDVMILIENMAGQGHVLGSTFEELKMILDGVENTRRIGICLDTCHLFGAGFDIRTEEGFTDVIEQFDEIIGLKYLKAVHLNDSKEQLGSRKDRHESICHGLIGREAFEFVMNSEIFDNIPLILETPDPRRYSEEISFLKSLIRN